MTKIVEVRFYVRIGNVGELTNYKICDLVAEKLAMSIMLRELRVNQCHIEGIQFDLDYRRNRDRRFVK